MYSARAVNDIDLDSTATATRDVLAGNDSIQEYHNQPPLAVRSRVVNGAVRVVAMAVAGDVTWRLEQLPAAAGVVRVLQQHGRVVRERHAAAHVDLQHARMRTREDDDDSALLRINDKSIHCKHAAMLMKQSKLTSTS